MSRKKRQRLSVARAQAPFERESEPSFKGRFDIVEWGGELYCAVDYTSGGAPIGLRLSELRQIEVRSSNEGWARAKRVLDCVFKECGNVKIGRVVKVGQGLSYDVFSANVEIEHDPDAVVGNYAVLLPKGTEARMLEARQVLRERVLRERAMCRHGAARLRHPSHTAERSMRLRASARWPTPVRSTFGSS